MLLAAFSRRMSCSRARMVMTKARRPSRSVVLPTSRPGIWRISASVVASTPRYGPPYIGAMPSGWPSPAAMSAPYAPGGASTASETGSTTATKRAPAACGAHGHHGGLGRGRRSVVVRGRNHVEPGQLGEERLVLVDRLQRALADLRLVGRVRGVELAAREDLVHC